MRGIILFYLFIMVAGCGGSLPDEQRKALKKEMENRKIKRVSEEQIFEKALEFGRSYMATLTENNADSLAEANDVTILFSKRITNDLNEEQKSILEAYKYSSNKEDLADNVQKSGDTILYAYPVQKADTLKGVWFIKISKKKIVLAL